MNSVIQIEVLEGICQRAKASGSACVGLSRVVTWLPPPLCLFTSISMKPGGIQPPTLLHLSQLPLLHCNRTKSSWSKVREVHFTVMFLWPSRTSSGFHSESWYLATSKASFSSSFPSPASQVAQQVQFQGSSSHTHEFCSSQAPELCLARQKWLH